MTSNPNPRWHIYSCDWCLNNPAFYRFSTVYLCVPCVQQALATPNPQNAQLCQYCTELFTSEYGFVLTSKKNESEAGLSLAEHNQTRRVETSDVLQSDEHDEAVGSLPRPVLPHYRPSPGTCADTGCPLCRILLVRDPNTDPGRFHIDYYLYALVRGGWEKVQKRLQGQENETIYEPLDIEGFYFESEPQFRLTLSVSASEGDPSSNHITQRPPEKYLGSIEINLQIQSWLKGCLQSHNDCNSACTEKLNLVSQLPMRLIDVGEGQSATIRIIESLYLPQWVEYVALSYCWGKEIFLTSTTQNIEGSKQGMDFLGLPQTFKDAIVTVRALGFRYLWIDALCILQDSPDDKLKEISRMGDIYHNASLTIASVGATKVADGFLTPKPEIAVSLPYRCPDGVMGSVQVSPQPVVDLRQQTLYTRAWCMQENLLSPRILVYTDHEVFWQCQTDHMKRPNTIHVSYEYDDPKLEESPFMRLHPSFFSPDSLQWPPTQFTDQEFYSKWIILVQAYTRRHLSVMSDRLPAIAGIAAKFQAAGSNCPYYAGHWERSFIASLSWKRRKRGVIEHPVPLKQYRAPSWSWASVEAPVVFERNSEIGNIRNLQAVSVSCSVEPVSDLVPMGEVRNGSAVINASMISASDLLTKWGSPGHDGSRIVRFYGITLDEPSPSEVKLTLHTTLVDYLSDDQFESAWFMLLGEGQEGLRQKFTRTKALVLMPAGDSNTFKRIGFFETSRKAGSKEWLKAKDRRTITII